MYPTTEARWFVPGTVLPEAEAWFEALGPAVDEAVRTDCYLVPRAENEPGIKLREGNLEVKTRTDVLGRERLALRVTGQIETFDKWSFPLAPEAPPVGQGWAEVNKTRRVRTFAREDGAVVETPDEVETGCDVELGEARLGERVWWTVCLEAFGPDEAVRLEVLLQTAARVFAGDAPLLDVEHSVGYVGWLCETTR